MPTVHQLFDLSGRVALVTGAGSGLGVSFAEGLRDLAVHRAPKGSRVNVIGPGYFPSAMTEALVAMPAMRQEIERRTPLGRIGRPDELKGAVVFLVSEASSSVTGPTPFVDGGWAGMIAPFRDVRPAPAAALILMALRDLLRCHRPIGAPMSGTSGRPTDCLERCPFPVTRIPDETGRDAGLGVIDRHGCAPP